MRNAMATAGLLSLLGCPALTPNSGPAAGSTRDCKGEPRVVLDCSSEVSYQGVEGEAGVEVFDLVAAEGKFEERAIRRVNAQVEQFVAAQTRACRDYNACILSEAQYRAEALDTRRRLQVLPALTAALKSSKSERERVRALDALYRGVVPDDKRVEEVSFRLGMVAQIPEDLGGGTFSVAPGGSVPSGARVYFKVDVSRDAHAYIFQVTPTGEVNVLFPDPRIGTQNPLPAGVSGRIPSQKTFRVTESDVGEEKVYVVVSREPVTDLGAALDKVKSGQVKTLADDQLLQSVAMVAPSGDCDANTRALVLGDEAPGERAAPGKGKGTCVRHRALALDEADGNASIDGVPAAMRARTPPGDGLIVTAFAFDHVEPSQFSAGATRGVPMDD